MPRKELMTDEEVEDLQHMQAHEYFADQLDGTQKLVFEMRQHLDLYGKESHRTVALLENFIKELDTMQNRVEYVESLINEVETLTMRVEKLEQGS